MRTEARATRFFSPPERRCGARSRIVFRDAVLLPAELQRAEGDLVENGGAEELHVGILEDEAHALAKGVREAVVLKLHFGERGAVIADGAGVSKVEAIEDTQQRGLAATIGAQQGEPPAGGDGERHAVERGDAAIGEGDVVELEDVYRHRATPQSKANANSTAHSFAESGRSSSTCTSPR